MAKPNSVSILVWSVKIVLVLLVAGLAFNLVRTVPDWTGFVTAQRTLYSLMFAILLIGILHRPVWRRFTSLSGNIVRALLIIGLTILAVIMLPSDFADKNFVPVIVFVYAGLILGIGTSLNEHHKMNLMNLIVSIVTLVIMLGVVEVVAPSLTESIAAAQRQRAIAAYDEALQQSNLPQDAAEVETNTSGVQLHSPQVEILETEPGPAWGELTGWGTSVNTVMHYWLEGVYDNFIEYNRLGFRGAEIPYEKPDDVYRILLIGDSFIEAREVAYEDTVYARLSDLLANATTPDGKRIEVFGVGATGWGTLQAYLYYHHEGQRFDPDLVIDVFVINDVADNLPSAFYPTRDIEFEITDASVRVIPKNDVEAETTLSATQRFFETLPALLASSNSVQLLKQVFDPPRQSVTIAGDLTRLHPQNYIYVRYPEVEHYPEAWERTRRAYQIWVNEVHANGAEMWVLAVDPSIDRISEVSTYFQQEGGWVWDVDLPTIRLHEILDPLNVPLIETRAAYEAYAESVNASPFSTLFYVEDGHWNPTGHHVTAELLATALRERDFVK